MIKTASLHTNKKIGAGIIRGRTLLEVRDTFFWNFRGAGIIRGGTLLEVLRYLFLTLKENEKFHQLFYFRFYKCIDTETGDKFSHEIIPNKTVCLNEKNAEWINAKVTFDNVLIAYLALFQVCKQTADLIGKQTADSIY